MSRPAGSGLLLAGVLLTGLNLRGAIAAVSPVLPEVRADLGLSAAEAGLLTTLPVFCFAALAPVAAWTGRRIGAERGVLIGLVALAVAIGLRVLDGAPVLLAGTFLSGAAMTAGNVLLPPVVKRDFGARAGTVTGLYTAALAGGAAAAVALTAPVAAQWGWRAGLACWSLLALVAAVVWGWATRRSGAGTAVAPAAAGPGGPRVWRSGLAWTVTGVLAAQSCLYYAVTAWLPSLLVDRIGSAHAGAAAAAVFQFAGIPGTLVVPALLGRLRGQSGLGLAVAGGWGLLVVGLLVAPAAWPAWAVVGGLAQGAGVALAYTLIVLRSADDQQARRLSGMAQLVGFGTAAFAPLMVGALVATTGGWTAPLLLLLGLIGLYAGAGLVAGRPGTLGEPLPARGSRLWVRR